MSMYGVEEAKKVDAETEVEIEDRSRHYADNSRQLNDFRMVDDSVSVVDTSITDKSKRETSITDIRTSTSNNYTQDVSKHVSSDININVSGSGNFVEAVHSGIIFGEAMKDSGNQMKIMAAFVVLMIIVVAIYLFVR